MSHVGVESVPNRRTPFAIVVCSSYCLVLGHAKTRFGENCRLCGVVKFSGQKCE